MHQADYRAGREIRKRMRMDTVPDLVSDTSDTDDDMSNYTYESAYVHNYTEINNERTRIMNLVVQIVSETISLRHGTNQVSLQRFIQRILERSGLGMTRFLRGIAILQRSTSSDGIFQQILYSMMLSDGLPQDYNGWSRISGISSNRLQAEVHTFASQLGDLAVDDEQVWKLNQSIKSEVLNLEQLEKIGVFYRHFETVEEVDVVAKERNYKNRDEIVLSEATFPGGPEALQAKLEVFYKEHLHEDEEIRYILDGEGYFDVRDDNDRWIRAKLTKGDLLILPAGIYHRFTLSNSKYVRALRLFKDEPKWVALDRGTDQAESSFSRTEYLRSVSVN
ncbi:hypothetical protein KL918_001761 [Ogataea parapolymorpha]|nr:hypothetical protein KL918_001761 [Ogataea parapolymorpha]KAG7874277.1 hypothetical protein KL916_001617 [Ogataea parapolymorpha]